MSHWPYPRLVAHRGGGRLAPENTLAGMRLAKQIGFQVVEFDVKLAADGVPMLMHDDTLMRTTNGVGLFRDFSAAQLGTLDAGAWKGPTFAGEAVPRFDETMQYLAAQNMLANIEIKPCAGRDAETGAVIAALTEQLVAGQAIQPLVSSFSVEALRAAAHAAPHLPRALLVEAYQPGDDAVVAELGCVALNCAWQSIDAPMLTHLKQQGLRVMAYTVNDVALAERLFALGVDGVFTDELEVMAARFPHGLTASEGHAGFRAASARVES